MRIEEIDDGIAEGSITLAEQDPVEGLRQDPAEGLRQDPAEDFPANLLLHAAQYAARVIESCSLYGCNQVVSRGSWYCCPNHENMSKALLALKSAYIIVDGFFGANINKNLEKDRRNVLAILKKADYGVINQGIITVEDPEIFQVGPWEWDFIDFNFLPGETDRSWLFFHKKTNPVFKGFDFFGARIRWSSFNYYVHEYQTEQGIVNVSSKVAYLRLVCTKKEEPMEGVDEWLKGWSLTEYTYNNKSLFCLSSSSDPNDLLKTNRVTVNEHSGGLKKGNEVKRKEKAESSAGKETKKGKEEKRKETAESSASNNKKRKPGDSVGAVKKTAGKVSVTKAKGKKSKVDDDSLRADGAGKDSLGKGKSPIIKKREVSGAGEDSVGKPPSPKAIVAAESEAQEEAVHGLKELVLRKYSDLQIFCRDTNLDVNDYTPRQAIVEHLDSDCGDLVLSALCDSLDAQLVQAKGEALRRNFRQG